MQTMEPISVTIPEAIRLTGLGRTKIYQLIADRRLRAIKIGRRTLIVVASIRALTGGEDAAQS